MQTLNNHYARMHNNTCYIISQYHADCNGFHTFFRFNTFSTPSAVLDRYCLIWYNDMNIITHYALLYTDKITKYKEFLMKESQIYSAIYDIVDENLAKAGKKLHTSKDLTLCAVSTKTRTVDIMKLARERNNDTFVKKAYILMLNRQIDKQALKIWRTHYDLPPEEFQRAVVIGIRGSEEFYANQVKMYNNIYSEHNAFGGNVAGIAPPAGITVPERMMKLYRKMPSFMKNAAKSIMGVKKS